MIIEIGAKNPVNSGQLGLLSPEDIIFINTGWGSSPEPTIHLLDPGDIEPHQGGGGSGGGGEIIIFPEPTILPHIIPPGGNPINQTIIPPGSNPNNSINNPDLITDQTPEIDSNILIVGGFLALGLIILLVK